MTGNAHRLFGLAFGVTAGAARINRTGLDGDSARADHADPT